MGAAGAGGGGFASIGRKPSSPSSFDILSIFFLEFLFFSGLSILNPFRSTIAFLCNSTFYGDLFEPNVTYGCSFVSHSEVEFVKSVTSSACVKLSSIHKITGFTFY